MSCKRTARRPARRLRVVVDSLAFGGDAVARADDGRVVFVPGGAPGDELDVEVEDEHKAWLRTRLARVVRPGPARIPPPCPVFVAGCGGCQWQHVDVAAQRAAKEEVVRRALRNLPATVEPIRSPAPEIHWRRRARLRFRLGKLGYARLRSHELVDVPACPQLEPGLWGALAAVRALLVPHPDAIGDVELLASQSGQVQVALSGRGLEAIGADALLGQGGIVSVRLGDRVLGPEAIDLGDDDQPFLARADSFAQASAPGNDLLRALVREASAGRQRVVELFAGAGNFTRDLLRAGATVVAVEESPAAAALAAANLAPWRDRLTFVQRSCHGEPPFAGGPFDLAVVDPPRTGLAPELARALGALACPLVYVSCDPQTLARDLAVILAGRAVRAVPVDLMPQTFHVEVVAVVEGNGAPPPA